MSLKDGQTGPVEKESSAKHTEFVLDDLHQEIDPRAIGGMAADLPKGYYRSSSFLGTFAAATTGVMCCYVSLIMPVNLLSIINADIGTWHTTTHKLQSSCGDADQELQVQAQIMFGSL